MNYYNGFSLNATDALGNIKDLLNVASLTLNSNAPDINNLGRSIIDLAFEYSLEAHAANGQTIEAQGNALAPLDPHHHSTPQATIGTRIKSMRELRNLGQFHLASSVGVTRSCIEAWEENTTIPASDKIIPLANALNCDPMWLLTGGDGDAQPADASPHASHRR